MASHIIPWSVDHGNRVNPRNGLCLNSLHDRAFDRGYITITPDYKVKIASAISSAEKDDIAHDFFYVFDQKRINLPDKFLPSREFLDYHAHNIFRG